MEVKMLKIINLHDVYEKLRTQSLPISTSYKISKLFNAVNAEKEFYTTQLNQIIQNYGKRDENGELLYTENNDGIQIEKENVDVVEAKLNDLWSIMVNLPDIKFSLKELEDLKLSVEEFNCLLPFIEE